MNLHQSKFILSKDRMKFLTANLLPAWLCGRKQGLSTSSVKQMSVEPPVHTCSALLREHLPPASPTCTNGATAHRRAAAKHGVKGEAVTTSSSRSLYLVNALTCLLTPVAPGSLHLSGTGLRWSPGSTPTAPSAQHCSCISFSTLESGYCYFLNSCQSQ